LLLVGCFFIDSFSSSLSLEDNFLLFLFHSHFAPGHFQTPLNLQESKDGA